MILAIDQGTTGSTCMVFSADGKIAGRAYREFEQHFPKPGWVEHDASEIWDVTEAVAKEAIDDAGIQGGDLEAIGITNQRETIVAWDKASGEPLARAIVWQDRRTADRCAQLKEAGKEQLVRERTGLVLDPYFSGTKIEWLIKEGGVDASRAAFGTIDAWLIHKLCDGRFATDYTNASRTLLFDIEKLTWSDELCEMLGVNPESLPEPCPSAHEFGATTLFGGTVPVAGVAGDQQAALYGQACLEPGLGKNTYGTGSFVLENAGSARPSPADGLLTTVAWGVEGRVDYALEAAIFVTGAAVQWLRDGLGVIESADETEALAESLDSNEGVYFVPALTGLGSPHWDPYARGTIVGLTRGSTKAHLARAALEAMAYQTVDAVRAMEQSSGVKLEELRADGGATANAWMLQFQADLLGVPVVVPEISETTALGAAYLAGVAAGTWSEADVRAMWTEAARYEPQMGGDQRGELMDGWTRAVRTTRNHSRATG
ncbi:MAG: glycerol kinase [Thermoleophilaceae bacterium]|nr:glycerol kinase [Thermoleophilaceae bacterium]